MADKLTMQEENGEKVFTVELAPGSEVTMQTADTYVDKNIKVNAKAYTGGTGITVDNNAYTISVDNTVVTTSNYSDTLDAVYQAKGNYQAAGDYLGPTNAVNDNTGNYVVNVTQDTRGQIKVTKGTLPSITVIEGSTTTPSTDTVDVLSEITSNGHAVTKQKTTVASKKYIDDLVGGINAILDTINGEVI